MSRCDHGRSTGIGEPSASPARDRARERPGPFIGLLEDFCGATEASTWSIDQWRELLRTGRAVRTEDRAESEREPQDQSERSAT
ncbi:MAG: hypothetical protein DLM67_22770 [Candidatus Nephthysia bennettiae]|nr:MAG: hypothetical protein DLM67_22770 [Candidatus Dormibacteraeota bacterium]